MMEGTALPEFCRLSEVSAHFPDTGTIGPGVCEQDVDLWPQLGRTETDGKQKVLGPGAAVGGTCWGDSTKKYMGTPMSPRRCVPTSGLGIQDRSHRRSQVPFDSRCGLVGSGRVLLYSIVCPHPRVTS